MKTTVTTLLFGALLLFGTALEAAAQDTVNYECGSGSPLTVTFQGSSDSVRINFDGTRANLRRVDSGSGAKYTGNSDSGKVTFWTQGDEAQLTVGGGFDGRCRETRGGGGGNSSSSGGSNGGGNSISYICSDVPLTTTISDDGSIMRFEYDGNNYTLRRAGSSSPRYTGNNQGRRVTFTTQGLDSATLTIGQDFSSQCTAQ